MQRRRVWWRKYHRSPCASYWFHNHHGDGLRELSSRCCRADTKAFISQFDTAPLPGPPPFPFALSNIPVGLPVEIVFFSAGQTFPLYGGSPPTNVFTVQTAGTLDLGSVTMSSGRATSQNPLLNVIFGVEDLLHSLLGSAPPPATLTVATPAPATGSVIVDFAVQNFVIGGQGQQHLHITVDGGATHHFFNGSTNNVFDDNAQPTSRCSAAKHHFVSAEQSACGPTSSRSQISYRIQYRIH